MSTIVTMDTQTYTTRVLIIGGGITGTGLARDLALRGIDCILTEKKDINAGASGANHGLLHSGARYIESDPSTAVECQRESALIKRLAPHCIENTGGLFVAVEGDDENYIADFPHMCARCGISATPLDTALARDLEPNLSQRMIAAFQVDDAAIDPFRLSLDNMAQARQHGVRLLRCMRVVGFDIRHSRIQSTRLSSTRTGKRLSVHADVVVNAAGAWAGVVAALAGRQIGMRYSKGSLLVTHTRLAHRVINRLRKATDADILVPGGTVSILGTTSVRIESPEPFFPEIDEVDQIIADGAAMIPLLNATRFIRAYCGVRPLISTVDNGDDRSVSRGFSLIDHGRTGLDNFVTISGGKLTTYRLMAEKTADLVCERLGVSASCRTAREPLPSSRDARWTEPGAAPGYWLSRNNPDDLLLCECEMVPQSAVDRVNASLQRKHAPTSLTAIGRRTRVGKGPCQGTFCSQRVAAHLYDCGEFAAARGVSELREFLNERWRGQRPLAWDTMLPQYELQEAVHCGIFGLELEPRT